jgi:hypothetical protein
MHQSPADFRDGRFLRGGADPNGAGITLICPSGELSAYESPEIDAGLRFNEAILSWNVDVPEQTGFCFEVRVGRSWDQSWSPYLYVGEGGAATLRIEPVTEFEHGRIDVDYFRSDEHFDRVQYRIKARSTRPDNVEVRIARVAICVSDLLGALPPGPPKTEKQSKKRDTSPSAWQRRLGVPFFSQQIGKPELAGRICSPTSVAMVLAYYGSSDTVEQVAERCYDPRSKIYGNWPRNVQALYERGVPAYLTRLSSWREVEALIADGRPLIISIRVPQEGMLRGAPYHTTDGHLIVVTGFDAEGMVEVNDPAVRDATMGQRKYYREDLERVWLRGASAGLAYVPAARESTRHTESP